MRTVFDAGSLVVISAGVAGDPCPTRLLADQIAESVCRSLMTRGQRVELEVIELRRLAADLAHHAAQGHTSLDLREALAVAAAADGLVVATPVVVASPSDLFDSFFAVLEDGALCGMPVLLAVTSGSRLQPPDIEQVMRGRLTCLHAEPVPTVVVAGPADRGKSASDDSTRLREHIDRAAVELAAAMGSHHR